MHVKREIKMYWDGRCKSYDKSPGHVLLPDVWREVLRKLFDDKMKILDVGCGTGFVSLILAELGHDVVGLDISRGMLNVAIEKAKERGLNVHFKLGDAENLPFKDNSFDAVICRHLIWTLPNPRKAISEFVRVSKYKVIIIDGKWIDNPILTRIRRKLGRLLISIYERRNLFKNYHYSKEINEMLPFYGGVSANEVVKALEDLGLETRVVDLKWIREIMYKQLPKIYRLAWVSRDYFMVEGVKSPNRLKRDI